MSANLTVSHYDELLKIQDIYEINYYIRIAERQNLSVRELRERILARTYEIA